MMWHDFKKCGYALCVSGQEYANYNAETSFAELFFGLSYERFFLQDIFQFVYYTAINITRLVAYGLGCIVFYPLFRLCKILLEETQRGYIKALGWFLWPIGVVLPVLLFKIDYFLHPVILFSLLFNVIPSYLLLCCTRICRAPFEFLYRLCLTTEQTQVRPLLRPVAFCLGVLYFPFYFVEMVGCVMLFPFGMNDYHKDVLPTSFTKLPQAQWEEAVLEFFGTGQKATRFARVAGFAGKVLGWLIPVVGYTILGCYFLTNAVQSFFSWQGVNIPRVPWFVDVNPVALLITMFSAIIIIMGIGLVGIKEAFLSGDLLSDKLKKSLAEKKDRQDQILQKAYTSKEIEFALKSFQDELKIEQSQVLNQSQEEKNLYYILREHLCRNIRILKRRETKLSQSSYAFFSMPQLNDDKAPEAKFSPQNNP